MPSPQQLAEATIEPELPIIDSHHHLWFWSKDAVAQTATPDNPFAKVLMANARYLLDEFLADAMDGHNVIGSVYAQGPHVMYRRDGPEKFRSLGEVEFATGVAAMAASGTFGQVAVANAIIGFADLTLGDGVEEVLHAHLAASGGRYRGVRNHIAFDPDPAFAASGGTPSGDLLEDVSFRAGMRKLRDLDLSYDFWPWDPQLPSVTAFVREFPDNRFVLDHFGTPLGLGPYESDRDGRLAQWQANVRELATCPNVDVKLGGLGMPLTNLPSFLADPPFSSEKLAEEWRPYFRTCVEAFGADRCMFESNFPVDSGAANYRVLWNAFKRLAAEASADEKTALFSGTARRSYRMSI